MKKLGVDEGESGEEEEDNVDVSHAIAHSFYYIGSKSAWEDGENKKKTKCLLKVGKVGDTFCRCPYRWHVIINPQWYILYGDQYTLFEYLKGNGKEEGLIKEGVAFRKDGVKLINYHYDLKRDEYNIKPVREISWNSIYDE